MVRLRWAAASALLLAFSGCIQTAPGAVQQAASGEPDGVPVGCQVLGEDRAPLPDGACVYRFGGLGATVEVDGDGAAVRTVPAGAQGIVRAVAPGHAMVEKALTVQKPVNIRFILPALSEGTSAASPPSGPGPEGTASSNATASAALANETEAFQPRMDELFRELYWMLPQAPEEQAHTFDVTYPDYDAISFVMRYAYAEGGLALPEYAANVTLDVFAPDGSRVVHYGSLDVFVYAGAYAITGGSWVEYPLGFLYDPMPGTYTVRLEGAGVPRLELWATGFDGLAPPFTYNRLDGKRLDLEDYRGNVTVVDFLSTWCEPCKEGIAPLRDLVDSYGGRVKLVTVDWDPEETKEQVEQLRRDYGITWDLGLDHDGTASRAYATGFAGTLIVVDETGSLFYRSISLEEQGMRDALDRALAEA